MSISTTLDSLAWQTDAVHHQQDYCHHLLCVCWQMKKKFSSFMDMIHYWVLAWSYSFITTVCDHAQKLDQSYMAITLPFLEESCSLTYANSLTPAWSDRKNIYDWLHFWNREGSSETVSDCPAVTVATLCWGFRTQQGWFLLPDYYVITMTTLPFFFEEFKCVPDV
jgi:hypothetical protein